MGQFEEVIAKNKILEEQVSSQQDMLARTTSFMTKIQASLEESKKSLEEKNNEIFDSIRYAERLQKALLPSKSQMKRVAKRSFILLNQRDIIGGDLPYYTSLGRKHFFAAIDCTGHGVPGAMLSMMANSMLNDIILQKNITQVNVILKELNQRMRNSLQRKNQSVQDGLDIALCAFDDETKTLDFSGAKRPLLLFKNSLQEIKGCRHSIGESQVPNFKLHRFSVNAKEKIYLFSDGITDQFGGSRNKKFGKSRLYQLIEEVKDLNLEKQQEIIRESLRNWQKNTTQTDDQLLLAIEF